MKYSATVVTHRANPDDSQTSVFPCVDADLIKSAFGKRRNMILTCSSDGRGEPKMMTHFSSALGCQTHWAYKRRMQTFYENVKKSKVEGIHYQQVWRSWPSYPITSPVFLSLFSVPQHSQFCAGESGIKHLFQESFSPRGRVCPCARGRESPWADVRHLRLN